MIPNCHLPNKQKECKPARHDRVTSLWRDKLTTVLLNQCLLVFCTWIIYSSLLHVNEKEKREGEKRQERQNISLLPFQHIHLYSRTKPIPKNCASVFPLVARNVIINVTTNAERILIIPQFNWTSIMKRKFLYSKNSVISRLGVLILVIVSSILLKREAKEIEILNFHVSVVILLACSAVRSVLHADKARQWSNFCTDDKHCLLSLCPLFSAHRESAPPSFCFFLFFTMSIHRMFHLFKLKNTRTAGKISGY
jgi:hypothetical protein